MRQLGFTIKFKTMETQKPQQESDPRDPQNNPNHDGTNETNDKPQSPNDGFSDQGSTAEEWNEDEQGTSNADESDIPELNPDRNDVEGQEPTPFDIDESTG